MLPIKLERPLCIFDIESTGTNVVTDRIIELAVIKLELDGTETVREWLLNPGIPIPEESIAVHGITDSIVSGCPTFKDKAEEIKWFFGDSDIGGYNVIRFDLEMLAAEFKRIEIHFDIDSRRVLDAQRIFHMREPRDLSAALKFYCGRKHDNAHGALPDTRATLDVLIGQLEYYKDLPRDIDELDKIINPRDPFNVDRSGRLRWVDGEVTINFGKKKGQTLKELVRDDPNFVRWIVKNNFPLDTRQIAEQALAGLYPQPPRIRKI